MTPRKSKFEAITSQSSPPDVPALEEVMREKRRNIEQSAQLLGGKPFLGIVTMQADKGIQFKIN